MSEFYSDSDCSLPPTPNSTRDIFLAVIDSTPVFYSFSHDEAVARINEDVRQILKDGYVTPKYSIIKVKSIQSSSFRKPV